MNEMYGRGSSRSVFPSPYVGGGIRAEGKRNGESLFQKRVEGFSIRRIAQKRETELTVPVPSVRVEGKVCNTILRGNPCSITVPMALKLAVKVWRPNRVNGPAVNMPRFSVAMIRFGMHME